MLQDPNPNQKTGVIIPHVVKPQKFASATSPHNQLDPQQNKGNWALPATPISSISPVESNHEATSKVQGEEHLEVQTPPPISTLPVKVLAAIGVVLLLLSCSLLIYKLIQDRRRQEGPSEAKTLMNVDQDEIQGEKGRILSQQGGTQHSISRPEMIHYGSHDNILKRETYRSQDELNNPDEKLILIQRFSQSSYKWNHNMNYSIYPPRYEEAHGSIETYYNSGTDQIAKFPINLDTPGFTGTRFRRSFVLNFNPYHHWERAINLQNKELSYFTQAMTSPNNHLYNEKVLSPTNVKPPASHQCISMNESQVIKDDCLPVPKNQGSELRTQNSQSHQESSEDNFFLETVEQKVDYVKNNHKYLSIHSEYDSTLHSHNGQKSKHQSIS